MVFNGLEIYQVLIKKLNNSKIIKNYEEDSLKGYILEVDVEYPKGLRDLHIDLRFLPEVMKTLNVINSYGNCMLKNYFIQIRALKQALNHELTLKKCP